MTTNQLKNLVAFCILMEKNGGIVDKSPGYIEEKFKRYVEKNDDSYNWGLDRPDDRKLTVWIETWLEKGELNE